MAKLNDIKHFSYNLSPHQLSTFEFKNKNTLTLSQLIDLNTLDSNKGFDVGSENYLYSSPKFFLRTEVLSKHSFIPCLDKDIIQPINPNCFINMNLRAGDIILTKDSNIGECAILPTDLPNAMLCGAFYKLPLIKHKYYVFAILKSDIFKNQLDIMVPKGVTIRHAGKKFLDCKIPFPKDVSTIAKVEDIVKEIVYFENKINIFENKIYSIIEKELQKTPMNNYIKPKVSFDLLMKDKRLDESFHDEYVHKLKFKIINYPHGFKTLSDFGYEVKRGQNLQVSQIGNSIYYNNFASNLYSLIKPTNFTNHGTISTKEYIGNKLPLSELNDGDIVFSAEGTIGKCVLFTNLSNRSITNIHGIVLYGPDVYTGAYISSVLRYYKSIKLFDYLSVGGQGGSLGPDLLKELPIPLIPMSIRKEIQDLYFNESSDKEEMGILQIDAYINDLKEKLTIIIDKIKNENNN